MPKAHGLGRVPVDHHLKVEGVAALVEPELPTAMLLIGIQVVTVAHQGDVAPVVAANADGIGIDPELVRDRIAQLDDFLSAARVEGTPPAKLAAAEEQRARLVNSLVQGRYAETLVSRSR